MGGQQCEALGGQQCEALTKHCCHQHSNYQQLVVQEECVEAHTNVDVVVNLKELRALLQDRLPLVYEGMSIEDAKLPWPAVE